MATYLDRKHFLEIIDAHRSELEKLSCDAHPVFEQGRIAMFSMFKHPAMMREDIPMTESALIKWIDEDTKRAEENNWEFWRDLE